MQSENGSNNRKHTESHIGSGVTSSSSVTKYIPTVLNHTVKTVALSQWTTTYFLTEKQIQ